MSAQDRAAEAKRCRELAERFIKLSAGAIGSLRRSDGGWNLLHFREFCEEYAHDIEVAMCLRAEVLDPSEAMVQVVAESLAGPDGNPRDDARAALLALASADPEERKP
jgi:hypothetical protein